MSGGAAGAGGAVLSPVEAQRAVAVLEETTEKLTFLGSITPDVLQHRDELSKFVGDEISRIIHEQRQLEARYESLIAQRGALKGLANKSKYKEVQSEIQDVSRALRDSTKNLCRNLKDNPNISGNLLKIQRERQELIDILQRTLKELQETGTFNTLVTKVQEDKATQDRLHDIIQRERVMADAVRQLDKDLTQEKVDHQRQVSEQKTNITQLKEQLQSIKSKTTVDAKYFRKEAHAKTCSIMRLYRQDERAQEIKISDLTRKLEVENVVHDETTKFLRGKQKQLNEELEKWDKKYKTDYVQLEEQYEKLRLSRMQNLERLQHLQERQAGELAAESKAKADAEEEAKMEALHKKEQEVAARAAAKIVRVMHAYLKRKSEDDARRAADKKKKGKKGGGKKKK